MRLHLVFCVSLLESYTLNSIMDHVVPPTPLVELDEGPIHEVKTILDSKIVCNKLYYSVD